MTDRLRRFQIGLGVVWLLDAALQYQPYMFSRAFAADALAATSSGNPEWIAGPIGWNVALVAAHPVVWNALFASVQLLLADGLLWRPTARTALACSIPWAVAVWWLGEGLGGLATGNASPLMGAPGAVILYALLAVLLWPGSGDESRPFSLIGEKGANAIWSGLWGGLGLLMLLGPNRSPNGTSGMLAGMAGGEPGWLQWINRALASAVAGRGLAVSVTVAAVFAAIGVGVWLPARYRRIAIGAAVLISLAIWVGAEDLGGILTGSGTDPNTGPLLGFVALLYRRPPVLVGPPSPLGHRPRLSFLPSHLRLETFR